MNRTSSFMRQLIGVSLLLLTSGGMLAQQRKADTPSPDQLKELRKLPLNDLGDVFARLQKEVTFPLPRQKSRLLPLLPQSTLFYAALPNYGDAAKQALRIFREERESRPALRKWWQSPDMAKTGPQFEMGIEALSNLAQFVGDEVAISGWMNKANTPSFVVIAEVRKPGLKDALDFALQMAAGQGSKPAVRVFDKSSLVNAIETKPSQLTILVRPDFVVAASDLETLRNFNQQLDMGKREFAATEFGQHMERSYSGGVSTVAGFDIQRVLRDAKIPVQQTQVMQLTGLTDMKYVVWKHRGVPGQPTSEGELSFTRPRRGIASWLAAPRELRSLDFASPNAILVASFALKNFGQIFDEIQSLATSANPNAFAQMDQMQQMLGINLKDDLLSQLGGEVTLELDNATKDEASWKAFLQVNDSARVQQTLSKLLVMAPVQPQQSQEDGVTYHSLTVPSQTKTTEIGYTFLDGYLVIGSGNSSVHEAVRLHRAGGSLAKSSAFLAALPPGHSMKASALYYQDPLRMMGMQMAKLSPEFSNTSFEKMIAGSHAVTCAYADDTTIRSVSMTQGLDVSTVLIAAAVAIPNVLRAKSSADESAAVATMRTIVTAQVSYSTEYPARGFARDIASLGSDPKAPGVYTPKHAGLLDMSFAKPECTTGAWCEKSGYKFAFAQVCPRLLCQEFVAVATPAANMGGRSFCATSEGIVRFRAGTALMQPISARECNAWQVLDKQ